MNRMNYIKLVIELKEAYQEFLIPELSELGFDGFENHALVLSAYISQKKFDSPLRENVEELLARFPAKANLRSEEVVAQQNWNEQWEQTIQAQQISSFFVKPSWSTEEVPSNSIPINIDPKMAFGTGYHETTRLVLRMLPGLVQNNCAVIDAGTGTGILSIAVVKLGAKKVLAFDVDEWCIQNANENTRLNEVENNISVKKGSTEVIPGQASADLLLANIEKNIIMDSLPDFIAALKKGGDLVLSGLLVDDREEMLKVLPDKMQIKDVRQENEWIAIHAQKQ